MEHRLGFVRQQVQSVNTVSAGTVEAPSVTFGDLERDHAQMKDELLKAFERVLDSSAFILGEEVERFEEEFAAYCGTRHCVGTASGTAALTLALLAAGIGRGDEVILPAHTYIASALAVVHAGAIPVVADVEDGSGLLDVDSAEAAIGERTAAVLAVHLYGQVCEADPLHRLSERHGLLLLEDAAQAHGAVDGSRRAGSLGAVAGFSFYPSKNLGALGDAGAITTNDTQIAERARRLRNLGQRAKGDHVVVGFNERLDGLQAAALRLKLRRLDRWNEARRERAGWYADGLGDAVRMLEVRDASACVYHLFPVKAPDRDGLKEALAQGGVEAAVHYSPPVHEHPALAEVVKQSHEPVNASMWARQELSLPIYPTLSKTAVEHIVDLCRAYAGHSCGRAKDQKIGLERV